MIKKELKEIKAELVNKISKHFDGKLNNEYATIYGHIINRIMQTTTINNDGTISYRGWQTNNNAMWQAGKYLYKLYADYNTDVLYELTNKTK